MKITLENWKDAERDLRESGIQEAVYDENGFVQSVTAKNGMNYEFSSDIIGLLIEKGAIEISLGRKAGNR